MFKWFTGLVDRCCAVVGAILFAQVPEFMQQYTQQLIGRTAEIKLQVNALSHSASLSGKSLEQLTQKFLTNSDPDIVRQGETMLFTIERWNHLSSALAAMQDSAVWSRPFSFLFHLNSEVFMSTFQEFKIGLPLNLEGGIYALGGVFLGYFSFACLKFLGRKIETLCFKTSKFQN
jgi:hypothetical protein